MIGTCDKLIFVQVVFFCKECKFKPPESWFEAISLTSQIVCDCFAKAGMFDFRGFAVTVIYDVMVMYTGPRTTTSDKP